MRSAWFPECGSNPAARVRLFCFAHAGGSAPLFTTWPRLAPPWLEVVPCHLPGRNERIREPLPLRLDRLLDAMEPEIQPGLSLPFALFGHSLGARVAFYLARRLRRNGLRLPLCLFASASCAPHLPSRYSPIHSLPLCHFMEQVQCRYEAIPDLILENPEALELYLSVLRADFSILETAIYRDEPALDCPIFAYVAKDDTSVLTSEVEAWSIHTKTRFRAQTLEGGHFYLRSSVAELLPSVVSSLQHCLENSLGTRAAV